MIRITFSILILLVITISKLFSQQESLNSLIEKAIELSPKLKMLELKKETARLRVIQNSNLPDPMLSLGISNLPIPSFAFNKEEMTEKMIGISQQIPFPGKLKRIGEVESKEVEIIDLELLYARNEVRREFIKSFNELRFVRKSIQLLENTETLLRNMSEIVRAQFIASKASQQNILKLELEMTNIKNMIEERRTMEKTYLAMINSFLFRSTDAPLQLSDFPAIQLQLFELKDLLDLARVNNPMLNISIVAKEKSKIEEGLTRFEKLPIFNFSAKYAFREKIGGMPMDDLFSLMVDVSLPLNYGGKISAKIEETQLMQNYFDRQYELTMQMLAGSISASISKINSLSYRVKLIEEGALVQARENLKTALLEYQVGKIDFINVIDAQMELLRIENELYRLKTDYLNEIAELEFLVGKKIFDTN